jgi:transcription termination factor Rho
MNKAELESKHLSELHALAAEAGVPKYRMLSRGELVETLSDGGSGQKSGGSARSQAGSEQRERPPRRRRRSGADPDRKPSGREPRSQPRPPAEPKPEPPAPAAPAPAAAEPQPESSPRPRRRRRRRRFGRRKDGVTIQDLLLPPSAGRQAILCAETREGCTALLRGVAADLAADSKGPDPIVLLIDPGPEELADWKREAPQAEIVAAGQPRHANDALAQAAARAGGGDDVMLLVDSLTRLAEAYGDADSAKEFFDAGRVQGSTGGGSLTVVVALERPVQS